MDGKQPCCSSGTIFPGGGILVFKSTVRRSCSPNPSTSRSGNVVLITDPIEQPDPSHQDSDNEPRHSHQVPGGGDPPVLPLMSNSSLPSLRNGILLHHHHTNSRRLRPVPGAEGQNTLEVSLLLNAVLNFSQPNQLNQGLDTSLFQSPPPSWLVVWITTKAGASTAS